MERKQRVTKPSSTPCDNQALLSIYSGGPRHLITRDGHEINELPVETPRRVHKTDQLPEKEDGAFNKGQEIGRDSTCARNMFGRLATKLWCNLISSVWETEVVTLGNELRKQENELREKVTRNVELTKILQSKDEELQNLKISLNSARQENLDIRDAGQREVRKLKSNIEQSKQASQDAVMYANQLKVKCQKLESQLALIEQSAAQESLTSGSYSDDHANPGMLEAVCKAVDKAVDDLSRVLHNTSALKGMALDAVELESLVALISPAHPADFSRPIQVKHVWGHWICCQVFRDFENVFFESDHARHRTSPLDSRKYALECFQSFQQKKSLSFLELLDGCGSLRTFFWNKYNYLFPAWLTNCGILPSGSIVDERGRYIFEGVIYDGVVDVAKAVWLLHELAFSFDPPASILRMARGEPYDKQFHDSVVHVEDGDAPTARVALMMRPAFRVRKSTVRSRVLLTKKLPQ